VFPKRETECFLGMKQSVSHYETKCFALWNKAFHAMKQMVKHL